MRGNKELSCNFFPIKVGEMKAFQYDVIITPEPRSSIDGRQMLFRCLKESGVETRGVLPDVPRDFKDQIRTVYFQTQPTALPESMTYFDKKASKEYTVALRFTREIHGADCGHHLVSVIIHQAIQRLNYVNLKKGFFSMENISRVERTGVALARGFDFSVIRSTPPNDYLLCIKPEFLNLRAVTLSQEVSRLQSREGLTLEAINSKLENSSVFLPHSNRFYRVKAIDTSVRPTDNFPTEEYKSFVDYFRKRYPSMDEMFRRICGIDIFEEMSRDIGMVTCFVPFKDRQFRRVRYSVTQFPLSICLMGGQPELSPLDRRSVTKSRQLTARQTIDESIAIIRKFIHDASPAGVGCRKILDEWKVDIGDKPMVVNATAFNMPSIETGGPKAQPDPVNGSIRRGLQGPTLSRDIRLTRWGFLGDRRAREALISSQTLTILNKMELRPAEPVFFEVQRSTTQDIARAFDEVSQMPEMPQILLIALNTNDARIYDFVKAEASRRGLITQYCNMLNFNRSSSNPGARTAYLWGMFQQLAAKIGCEVWRAEVSITPFKTQPTMIAGIHFVPGMNSKSEYGASNQAVLSMSSSIDAGYVRHFSQAKAVPGAGSLGSQIGEFMENALTFFYFNNGRILPHRIVIFRSGLPDGRAKKTASDEIAVVRNSVSKVMGTLKVEGKSPCMSYVIAKKGTKVRFSDAGRNPVPGTMVRDTRIAKTEGDFYLITGSVPVRGREEPSCVRPLLLNLFSHEQPEEVSAEDIAHFMFITSFDYVNYPGPTSLPISLRLAARLTQHIQEHTKCAPIIKVHPNSICAFPYFI